MNDSQLNLYANHLSGGQQRILDFGLCLIGKPKLLILDEPTAGLDPQGALKIMNLLSELNKEGITIVISTLVYNFYEKPMLNFRDKITQ